MSHCEEPRIGIAYSSYVPQFLAKNPTLFDFVEIPFEHLQHDPATIKIERQLPIILHCASLSIAGTVRPSYETVAAIKHWVKRTNTPWLGEHLAFVTAESLDGGDGSGKVEDIGFTIAPQTSEESLERILGTIRHLETHFAPIPLLLENPPVYMELPGSTMSQMDFIRALCHVCDTGLLLDLTHFAITCKNLQYNPQHELSLLPLARVVEVHISGMSHQGGLYWDDHSRVAPDLVFDLLSMVIAQATPRAITLEYNWSPRFPFDALIDQVSRTRALVNKRKQAT